MSVFVVVSDPRDWKLDVPGVEVVTARAYLTEERFAESRRSKVFNLCRSYRYQRTGYYVSLLAEARGHLPLPAVGTIQDLKSPTVLKYANEELDAEMERSLGPLASGHFTLSVYFGRNVARRHDRLAAAIFRLFEAPLLRAEFARGRAGRWSLTSLNPIGAGEIPDDDHEFAVAKARELFAGGPPRRRQRRPEPRFDLAILRDPSDREPASDTGAMRRFVRAGRAVGFAVDVIGRKDYAEIPRYDALFIRDTTAVNHYTYHFARKAKAEGLVVVDEPETILRCMNKVYLAELLGRHGVRAPRTLVVHRGNVDRIESELGLPCVLKQPDSAFSAGVVKVETAEELRREASRQLERSALLVAQEFLPTPFDWRIGVERLPLPHGAAPLADHQAPRCQRPQG
ncbi:MAG: RimK-like ATPgrasp N-terminal domain-containing protein, partial [Thermoanaerobaculia bacterium]|nr:RimK-like ATPgrasp N-terminal domain-containing protein [Thermoanaerobaculia bacterium]